MPPTPPELKGKNMVYVFDSEDSFNLSYDELVEIISKARMIELQMIPVLGMVGDECKVINKSYYQFYFGV